MSDATSGGDAEDPPTLAAVHHRHDPAFRAGHRQFAAGLRGAAQGEYDLEVIDFYQHPAAAKEYQIVAAPTLVKLLPLPLRRIIGDLANEERVLAGLDLSPKADPTRK